MEEIRSSLDNIMAQFNDSFVHSAPKKLCFDRLSVSLNESDSVPKRRRLDGTPSPPGSVNVSVSSLDNSSNDVLGPWQARRLRAELIETKAIVTKLQDEMEQKQREHLAALTLEQNRSAALKEQCDFTASKLMDLEQNYQIVRKREHAANQEVNRLTAKLSQQKTEYEQTINELEQEKMQQEEDARDVQYSINADLGEYRRLAERNEIELQNTRDELNRIRSRYEECQERTSTFDDLKKSYEIQMQDLMTANARIKDLEFEIASYNDWKEVTKATQTRLLSIPNMQSELDRLRLKNKELHSIIGNKLLLEEQVHDYKMRLDKEDNAKAEAAALQVKLSHIEQELKEWVKVAQDHCLPNTLVSPMALRSRLEQLLQEDIVRVAEKSFTESDTKHLQKTVSELESKCNMYMKNIEDMNMMLKRNKNFKERLQRKLLMVCKERDFYKQLLENFDKDMTMTNATIADMSNDVQVRYRVEVLERTVNGYKDMCSALEREMQAIRQQEILADTPSEGYDGVKKELDTLRLENEKLRRRKEDLELELEHRCLRGDFNLGNYKVVHFTNNPAAEAYENSKNIMEKLQAEIERLKRRNKKLEEDNESTQARFNETTGMTMNFKEVNQMRMELESANAKMKKMKDCFKAASVEFRDVCYMLLGYRIDRIGANSHYRISSIYAESPEDYLAIRVNESNCLELLETPYSHTLTLLTQQLASNNSFPAFFSALTLELFEKTTVTIT